MIGFLAGVVAHVGWRRYFDAAQKLSQPFVVERPQIVQDALLPTNRRPPARLTYLPALRQPDLRL
jgi:hypothetical protein